ncbi:MAG: glycosyltransferase family 39 protein [Flavobacteriales bacterium]
MFADRQGTRSLLAVGSLWAFIVAVVLYLPPSNVLSWDVFGYYLYLPATLLHGDLALQDQSWVREVMSTYDSSATFYQAGMLADGRWIIKYPMGLAILLAPFFLLGHLVAIITGAPLDGFSTPYQWAIIAAHLIYALIGMLFLRRVLLRFFSDGIVAWVLVLLVLGTNYMHQAMFALAMPHVMLFTLYAGILWCTIRWHDHHRWRDTLALAVLMGMAILSRPSEVVCVFIPLLYGLTDLREWRAHVAGLFRYRGRIAVVLVILLLIGAPQFFYYKWLTGKFLYLSYNNPGEGMELLHPHIREVLFSFRKGWFIYTPMMAFATGGLFLLRRELPSWSWAVVVYFVVNLYVVSSWSCWWYADSFGQRALVQSYAVMALPLAAVLVWISQRAKVLQRGLMIVLIVLVLLNMFQSYQAIRGIIHSSRMTFEAYCDAFFRTTRSERSEELLLVDRNYWTGQGEPDLSRYNEVPYLHVGFESPDGISKGGNLVDSAAFEGKGCYEITSDEPWTPAVKSTLENLTEHDHVWVKVSCMVRYPQGGSMPAKVALVATFDHNGHSYMWKATTYEPSADHNDGWVRMTTWYLTPEVRVPSDNLLIYAWLQEGSRALIDDMTVTLYEPKADL